MSRDTFRLDVTLTRNDTVPLHAQIANPLRELIETGKLPPGTRLEDEVSMAKRLQVSRPTARKALETLANLGLIARRRGSGTEVTPRQVHRPMALTSLYDDLRRGGHTPQTSVLDWEEEVATPSIASMLGLPEGSKVVSIHRLRLIDDRPLAIMRNFLPTRISPSRDELAHNGLYELLRRQGIEMEFGTQQIGARLATPAEARLLDEPPGAALLTMQRVAYDKNHLAIEVGMHVYRASLYTYSQTLHIN